jgi:ATPase subunit of ABC transporter with duplicated ATPase domains
MFEINNLSIKQLFSGRILVDSLSLRIKEGDKVALIGEEGVGKSVLLRYLASGRLDPAFEAKGSFTRPQRVGYLPQEAPEAFLVQDTISFLLKDDAEKDIPLERYELTARFSSLLSLVGFDMDSFDESKTLSSYSGGEKVKLSLVKLLLRNPEILMLDEPSNDLDLGTMDFLSEFLRRERLPIIFVSHDERLLSSVSTTVIHLEQIHSRTENLTTFMDLNYSDYKAERTARLERQGSLARKQRDQFDKKMRRYKEIYEKVKYAQNQAVRDPITGRLLKKKMHALKSEERRLGKEKESFEEVPDKDEAMNAFFSEEVSLPASKVVFALVDVPISDSCGHVLVKEARLSLVGPSHIAIVGKNGIGKSSFLRELYAKNKERKDIKLAYMPQDYSEILDYQARAIDYLVPSLDKNEVGRVRSMMGALRFETDEMLSAIGSLSGGQKAKLLILKMIIDKANVLLLDEPTRNLSPLNCPEVFSLINSFKGAVVAVTHERAFLESSFKTIYRLDKHGFALENIQL